MKYTKEFNSLIDQSIEHKQYVGLGNPNAKILFVGKEAGLEIGTEMFHGSAESCKENDYSLRYIPEEKKIRSYIHTWQKYQKLYELILSNLNIKETEAKKDDYEITFVENVFTTELSNLPAPNANQAKTHKNFKPELEKRKKYFWKSEFIKNFPIVIIAASDKKYIETYKGEVCELFGVNFHELLICEKSGKIWIHYGHYPVKCVSLK